MFLLNVKFFLWNREHKLSNDFPCQPNWCLVWSDQYWNVYSTRLILWGMIIYFKIKFRKNNLMDIIMYTEGPAPKCIIKLGWKPKSMFMQRYLLVYLLFAFAKRRYYYINQRSFNSCLVIIVPTLSSGAKVT